MAGSSFLLTSEKRLLTAIPLALIFYGLRSSAPFSLPCPQSYNLDILFTSPSWKRKSSFQGKRKLRSGIRTLQNAQYFHNVMTLSMFIEIYVKISSSQFKLRTSENLCKENDLQREIHILKTQVLCRFWVTHKLHDFNMNLVKQHLKERLYFLYLYSDKTESYLCIWIITKAVFL